MVYNIQYPEVEKIMVRKHLSIRWLADAAGISHNTLYRKLRGTRGLKGDEARKIAEVLHSDLSISVLFAKI